MNSVSFKGTPVFVNPTKKIINATASEIAAAVRQAHEMASRDLGIPVRPLRPISGKKLREINPDSFERAGTLTLYGQEAFNYINGKQLGITIESTLNAYSKAIRNFIKNNVYHENDGTGSVSRYFDIIQ